MTLKSSTSKLKDSCLRRNDKKEKKTWKFFTHHILDFHKTYGRHHLPWREKNITPYHVWVSEIMLQQTQVNRVIDYFTNFIQKYPTIFDLAQSNWEEFLPYYQGLGYYRRGQNMLKAAKYIVKNHNGIFPQNKKELIAIPGIGDYTASAILSFGYGENHLAFDTNLQKVFGRYLHGNKKAKLNVEKIENELKEQNTTVSLQTLNGAIMDFANILCTRKPKCPKCPIQQYCQYVKTEGKLEATLTRKKDNFPSKEAQVFLWLHKDHKEYYSANPDTFEVFTLSKEHNTRKTIKEYFSKNYNLNIAVRPPHKKEMVQNVPTLFINAQILSGTHEFGIFTKSEIPKL